jgi:hypothetical protein
LQTQLRNFTSARRYFSEIPYLYLGRLRQAPETAACSPIYIDVGPCDWFARPPAKEMTLEMNFDQARKRAESSFKKDARAREGAKAMSEYEANIRAVRLLWRWREKYSFVASMNPQDQG